MPLTAPLVLMRAIMGKTLDQALQEGIAAHKAGKLKDAERLYKTILETQPEHPTANHNLGSIAASMDQFEKALTLFKTALDNNPDVEKFWYSYIGTLVKTNQLMLAEKTIERAKRKGLNTKKLQDFFQKLKNQRVCNKKLQDRLNVILAEFEKGQYSKVIDDAYSVIQEFPRKSLKILRPSSILNLRPDFWPDVWSGFCQDFLPDFWPGF